MDHPFRNILLATERTEFDSGAERVALEMARRCNLPLSVVVPVLSNPEFEMAAHRLADRTEQDIAARVDDLRMNANKMGVSVDIHARRGDAPADEIVQEALNCKSDLIVIRRRGRRGFLAKLLVGEMVSRIIDSAPCSVLMVPRACSMWSRGILAAVDESEGSASVASVAAAIAVECGLPLHVLGVASSEASRKGAQRNVSVNADLARALGAEVHEMVRIGRPCDEILATPADVDLIVVGMGNVRSGGTTQKVVGRAEKPVLAVRL